jgi:hypothetical protein
MAWVHDQIYVAGGEYLPSHWVDFVDQTNVRAVLHLRPGSPAIFKGPPPEGFLWMDVEDEEQAGLQERWLAASFIAAHLEKGVRVLLHSSLRRHRVRWAYVAYMIWNGRSVRASLREVEEKPWLSPYHTERKVWEDFKQYVEVRRMEKDAALKDELES